MFLDQAIHFGKNLVDQVKGRSPIALRSLIEVPKVAPLNVHALSFNMNLFLLCSVFLDRVIHFGGKMGDKEKVRSPKKMVYLIYKFPMERT